MNAEDIFRKFMPSRQETIKPESSKRPVLFPVSLVDGKKHCPSCGGTCVQTVPFPMRCQHCKGTGLV